MITWLVTIGEPVPLVDGPNPRLLRTGVLAKRLRERGHAVVWWTSGFDHFLKRRRVAVDTQLDWNGVSIRMLRSWGYRRNLSLRRLLDHAAIARRFRRAISSEPRPDVILAALPTVELARNAVGYAKANQVPVLVDIRDLWPDILTAAVPRLLRPLSRLALYGMASAAREALSGCDGIIGISDGYLQWGLACAGRDRRDTDGMFPLGYVAPEVSDDARARAGVDLVRRGVNPAATLCWFIGSFGRLYDLEPVLRSAARLAAAGRADVQFAISGAGEQSDRWRRLAAGCSNVVFTGWISGDEIGWLRQHARIGLQAYAVGAPQGLANKLFEYLSAGIPVLSSLGGENAALIAAQGCGLSYAAGDGVDFERQLCAMLAQPEELVAMGQRGRALYEQRYAPTVIFDGLIDHLERVVNRYPGGLN